MTLTIGRAGTDVALGDPATVNTSGDRLRLTGFFKTSSLANAKALRQQLVGHVDNPDEPVVPVTSTLDSTIDGFYRVLNVAVDLDVAGNDYNNFRFPYAVDLERAGGTNAVGQAMVNLVGATRTNSHGITTTDQAIVGGGTAAGAAQSLDVGLTGFGLTRVATPSNILVADFSGVLPAQAVINHTPSTWYTHAPKIEVGSGTKRVVVGKDIENLPQAWQMSNGLIRVSCASGSVLTVEAWDGSAWTTGKSYQLKTINSIAAYVAVDTWTGIQVLRNGVDRCTVKLIGRVNYNSGVYLAVSATVSLRRAQRVVEIHGTSGVGYGASWGISMTGAEAATSITGGVRATSNDAGGDRFVIAAPSGTKVLTSGSAGFTGINDFGVGLAIDGSSAVSPETTDDICLQFFGAVDETITYTGAT